MKKLLLGSISLFLFAASIMMVQVSCSKTTAQSSANSVSQLNRIIYTKDPVLPSDQKEIWTSNYDGTNPVQVPLIYPAGLIWTNGIEYKSLSVSPDGQTVFFVLSPANNTGSTATFDIYSCPITGGTATLVAPGRNGKVQAY